MERKVLIVEDELGINKSLSETLKKEGFFVLSANNGRDGLDLAISGHPDLILLDIVLPMMNGLTVLEAIRKDSWGKNAKVIMFTNLGDVDKMAKAMELGAIGYLIKSELSLAEIAEKVKKHF